MLEQALSRIDYPASELVFGVVSAVGTDGRTIRNVLEDRIKKYNYTPNVIRLSKELDHLVHKLNLNVTLRDKPEYERINTHMNAGDRLRNWAKCGEVLALFGAARIAKSRKRDPSNPRSRQPLRRTAHILMSLKHPDEVMALRRIYGPGFFLIGVFATEEERIKYLQDDMGIPPADVKRLIKRDAMEDDPLGQQTRDTFSLADAFVHPRAKEDKRQLWRFLDVVFEKHDETPSRDEYAMFFAYSASTRSASLSRQVGAAITNKAGEIIAIGCNEVPRPEGGLYWGDDNDDQRDHKFEYKGKLGLDTSIASRDEIIEDVMKRLRPKLIKDRLARGRKLLADSPLMDITEYGRAVHAEMEAMLACARVGVSPRKGTLYCTTFPCHNCTKHIVDVGIERVVYIEPYPKSRAMDLHPDSVTIMGKTKEGDKRVIFDPFVGIGPRRFFDLFSMKLSSGHSIRRRQSDGVARKWDPKVARMRVPMLPYSYIQLEQICVDEISNMVEEREGKTIWRRRSK